MYEIINIIESRSNLFYFIVDVSLSKWLPVLIFSAIEKVWSKFNYINNVWQSIDKFIQTNMYESTSPTVVKLPGDEPI